MESQIENFQPPTDFKKKHWRRLICQLREIFAELHRAVEANVSDESTAREKPQHLNLIEQCQLASDKCINVIEKELATMKETDEEAKNAKESFKLILMLWKLCQIVFIKSSPAGALLIDLQEWYKSTNNIDAMVQMLFSANAKNMTNISKDENYWFTILMAVAQGRIDTARHLISFHPLKNSSAFKAIDEQMRNIPNFAFLAHLSLFEFKAKWEYWQKKCIQVLTTEDFSVEETGSLEIICKMLCADEKTFIQLKPLFNNWYYMLIAFAAYSNPTLNISELHQMIDSGTFLKAFEDDLDVFDLTIKSIFDFEIEIVIRECVQFFGNHLFTSHLLQLLYLSGKLEFNKNDNTFGRDYSLELVHEHHLNDYGRELLESDLSSLALFQTACDYLCMCKSIEPSGLQVIEAYMQRIPLTHMSESNAAKVFVMAYQFGLHDLVFSIGRCMQMRALKRGMLGDALAWNVRIKDACFGNMLGERIFDKFIQTNDSNLLNLVESVSHEIIFADKLIFLSKYREYFNLVNSSSSSDSARKQDLIKGGSLMLQMLETPKLVPLRYRKKLLFDIRTLVYANVLNEDQLTSILCLIQNCENRDNFFRDDYKFNRAGREQSEIVPQDDDAVMESSTVDEIEPKKWTEYLNEITKRIAEVFVKTD